MIVRSSLPTGVLLPRRRYVTAHFALLGVLSLFASSSLSAQSGARAEDPLLALRGKRVVVEFPDLSDVGRQLVLPSGWAYLQVTTETYERFEGFLDPRFSEALLFFDQHGNYVAKLHGADRFARLEPGLEEVDQRIQGWVRMLRREWAAAEGAREDRKHDRELKHLLEIRNSKLVGYSEVVDAEARLAALEKLRTTEFWQILALEGTVKKSRLERELSQLLKRTTGLTVGGAVARELERVEAGRVTALKPRKKS